MSILIPCLCLGVILMTWERGDPSILDLEIQIRTLQRQLQGYDKLKEEYDRDKIEIGWDLQHMEELKERKYEISNSLTRMTETFKNKESSLKEGNEQMARYLAALHEHNAQSKKKDMQTLQRLKEESDSAHRKANHEHAENMVLKEILREMQSLLDIEKANVFTQDRIRGDPNPEDES